MKAKLIKKVDSHNGNEIYYSLIIKEKCIGTTHNLFNKEMKENNGDVFLNKLSKQNCDSLFGVVDVEKLADDVVMNYLTEGNPNGDFKKSTIGMDDNIIWWKAGFNKAMELNKDKVFSEDIIEENFNGLRDCIEDKDTAEFYIFLAKTIFCEMQPTEIDVTFNPDEKDSDVCLILKKI
jgi:hypothetical protein